MLSAQNFCPVPRTHAASRKGLLDGAVDLPSFSVGIIDPAHSSRDMPVNFDPVIDKERKLISN